MMFAIAVQDYRGEKMVQNGIAVFADYVQM